MSVKGPGPTGPSGIPEIPDDGGGVVETSGSAALDRSTPVSTPQAPDAISALADGLQSGAVKPEEALGRLLDMAAERVPAAMRAQVRAELEAALKEDPNLAERARRLGLI